MSINVDSYRDSPFTVRVRTNARLWQRKKVCAMAIKYRVYKSFRRIVDKIQMAAGLNEHIQKYAGKTIPSTFLLKLSFEKTGDKYKITVDKWNDANNSQ